MPASRAKLQKSATPVCCKKGFTISNCCVGVSQQQRKDPSTTPPSSPTMGQHAVYPLRPKNSPQTHARLAQSQRAVQEHNHMRRQEFLVESEAATRMLHLSRHDQQVAVTMLVEESWRYQQAVAHEKEKDKEPRRSKSSPQKTQQEVDGTALTVKTMTHLLNDVDVLMNAPVWQPLAPGDRATVEKHPYLFTINEIHRLNLFVSTAPTGLNREQ